MNCPHCKHPLAKASSICPECGRGLPRVACPTCGVRGAYGAGFCAGCGGDLSASPAPKEPAAVTCPKCGTEEPPGAKFCKKCGAPLAEATPPPPPPVEEPVAGTCPKCGTEEPPGAKFCKQCGAPLAKAEAPSPPAPVEEPAAVTCPKCGLEPLPGARFCKGCGTALSGPPRPAAPREGLAEEPLVSSGFIQGAVALAAGAAAGNLSPGLSRATGIFARLLKPAQGEKIGKVTKGKVSWLEIVATLVLLGVVAGFFLLCLYLARTRGWYEGWATNSGIVSFLVYVLGLFAVLRVLRSPLDGVLRPLYGQLARIPTPIRVGAGLLIPLLYCFWDSEDRNQGFQTARWTITVATLLGHVLLRAGTEPPPSKQVSQEPSGGRS